MVSGPFANLSSDFNPLVDFMARERSLQTIEFRDFRSDVVLSMQKRALIRRIGLFLFKGRAQYIVEAGVTPSLLLPRPLPQTILISFLVIFPLIFFTAVLTAALMCQVLIKHLALFSFH